MVRKILLIHKILCSLLDSYAAAGTSASFFPAPGWLCTRRHKGGGRPSLLGADGIEVTRAEAASEGAVEAAATLLIGGDLILHMYLLLHGRFLIRDVHRRPDGHEAVHWLWHCVGRRENGQHVSDHEDVRQSFR